MKRVINHVQKHSKKIATHLSKHKHKYLFGTFGTFAIVKCFLLLVGFFGTLTISNIFAAGGELNSGNIVTEYGCAADATNCDLNGLGITNIAADTFVNHTRLTSLYLSKNQISVLPDGIFDSLTGLIYLYLSYNQIAVLPDGIFDSLTGLIDLELSSNQLSTIDLSGLSKLTYLRLEGNQITTLSEDIITLTNLMDNNGLNIYYNHIDYTQLSPELLAFINQKHVTWAGDWRTLGCIDSSADNYNTDARQDDGSCEYGGGCTDPDANNYNRDANQDDGSCEYGGGGDDGDYEGNLWVTGSLYTTRNIYSGTLVILPINYGYDGSSYTFATLQLATPFGFEMTDIFGSDWDTHRSVLGYGGPGDQCYTQFLENTGGYVTQTNDLLEMLLPSVIYYDSGWQIDLSIMEEGFILPVTQFTTGITQSTGLTQRVYLLAEVFPMREDEDMIAMATTLADELDHGTPASTLIGDLCTTMSEEGGPGLNVCEFFGNIISEFILDLSFNKQESIWTLYMENIFDRISDTVLSNSGGTYYMDFTTINPDMIIPVISYQTEILATTGATQRTWIIAELFSGVGASDFAANIETALNQGSGGMELLSGICATMEIMGMGEGNLKDCKVAGEFIKNNSSFLGLDTVPDCGANIYTTNTDNYGQINQGVLRNASVFGVFPYQEDGITFGVSLIPLLDSFYEQRDDRDDNNFSLHIDMVPDGGISCINSGNSMEITHGDIQEVYVVYEDVCTPIMGLCIEGDMYGLDEGATIPIPDNVYYADDTCTIPVRPTATNVHIVGDPIVGSMLTGVYTYTHEGELSRSQVGSNIYGETEVIFNDHIPYIIYYNSFDGADAVMMLSGDTRSQVGNSFTDGEIGSIVFDQNIPYITFNNYSDGISAVMMLSGDTRSQVGNSFTDGEIGSIVFDQNIPYITFNNYSDGISAVMMLSGDTRSQVGNSFTDGNISSLVFNEHIPYVIYYNFSDGSYSYAVMTLSGNTRAQVGDSFTGGSIRSIVFDQNIPYITFNNYSDGISAVMMLSGNTRSQVGNSFTGGSIRSIVFDQNIPYIIYYSDGISAVMMLSGNTRSQVGNSFTDGEIGSIVFDQNIPYITLYQEIEEEEFVSIRKLTLVSSEEGASTYQRYRDDSPIAGATALSYTTTALDTDKDISFGVIPTTENGILGLLTKSDAVHIDASQDDILGCTDPDANNYNPNATIDDESCEYDEDDDVNPSTPIGGGGGGSSLQRDICEGRDCSNSYYDGFCGSCNINEFEQQKIHGAAQEFLIQHKELFNQEVEKVRASTTKTYSDELLEAYTFAKDLGVTTMSTIDQADLEGSLIRSHMAKMISNYAIKVIQTPLNTGATCSFSDMKYESEEMQGYAILSCQLGLMGQNVETFKPNDVVTRAEFGTVLSRILRDDKNEGGSTYYEKHLNALKTEGIMTKIENPSAKELRGRTMLMMMRMFEK